MRSSCQQSALDSPPYLASPAGEAPPRAREKPRQSQLLEGFRPPLPLSAASPYTAYGAAFQPEATQPNPKLGRRARVNASSRVVGRESGIRVGLGQLVDHSGDQRVRANMLSLHETGELLRRAGRVAGLVPRTEYLFHDCGRNWKVDWVWLNAAGVPIAAFEIDGLDVDICNTCKAAIALGHSGRASTLPRAVSGESRASVEGIFWPCAGSPRTLRSAGNRDPARYRSHGGGRGGTPDRSTAGSHARVRNAGSGAFRQLASSHGRAI